MKKLKSILAISLASAMIFGTTAFAGSDNSGYADASSADAGTAVSASEVESGLTEVAADTDTSNDARIAATAAEVLSKGTYTYTNSAELARLVQLGYSCNQSDGPISITKATLNYNNWWGTTKDVYVVCLSGTDTDVKNQSTGWFTDLLVGFEFNNAYIRNVKKAILENIPAGSNIIVTGHSLGGMVAQQVASESELKSDYNILNTVTFGSPLINGFSREGTVKRLGDTNDVVPYLSVSTLTNVLWQTLGLNRENGGYGWNLLGAHCESYQRADEWGAYDVTGTKGGRKTLTLDFSTTAFYHSPVIVTE